MEAGYASERIDNQKLCPSTEVSIEAQWTRPQAQLKGMSHRPQEDKLEHRLINRWLVQPALPDWVGPKRCKGKKKHRITIGN